MPARISQIAVEALGSVDESRGVVSQYLVEVLVESPAFSPTTPTGVGVSQDVVEVLCALPSHAYVGQEVIEVLCSPVEIDVVVSIPQAYGFSFIS